MQKTFPSQKTLWSGFRIGIIPHEVSVYCRRTRKTLVFSVCLLACLLACSLNSVKCRGGASGRTSAPARSSPDGCVQGLAFLRRTCRSTPRCCPTICSCVCLCVSFPLWFLVGSLWRGPSDQLTWWPYHFSLRFLTVVRFSNCPMCSVIFSVIPAKTTPGWVFCFFFAGSFSGQEQFYCGID